MMQILMLEEEWRAFFKIRPSSWYPKCENTWMATKFPIRQGERLLLTQDKTFGGSSDFSPVLKQKNILKSPLWHPQILFLGRYRSSGGWYLQWWIGWIQQWYCYLQKHCVQIYGPPSIYNLLTFSYQFFRLDLHTGHSERHFPPRLSPLQRLSNS